MLRIRKILTITFVALLGYTISITFLAVIVPTDYPHAPDDDIYDLAKAVTSVLLGVLCALQYDRMKLREK